MLKLKIVAISVVLISITTGCSTEKLEQQIQLLNIKVDQQSSLLSRSLGKAIPMVLPQDVEKDFSEIESQLKNKAGWPTNSCEVTYLNERLGNLVKRLQPWEQEELMPRLIPRRWEIEALWIVLNEPLPGSPSAANCSNAERSRDLIFEAEPLVYSELLSAYASSLQAHISNKPIDSSNDLEERLNSKVVEIKRKTQQAEQVEAIEAANKTIKAANICFDAIAQTKGNLSKESISSTTRADCLKNIVSDIDTSIRRIALYLKVDSKVENPTELDTEVEKVYKVLIEHGHMADLIQAELDFSLYSDFPIGSLRDYAILRINQTVMDLQLRAKASGISNIDLNNRISNLEKTIDDSMKASGIAKQSKDAEKLKQYQIWALTEIKKVRLLKDLYEKEINKLTSSVWVKNNPLAEAPKIASGIALRVLLEEMVEHMAPVNQAYLEPAVAQWYGKVYQQRFSEFKNEENQLEIVTRFATTSKKSID